MPTAELEVGSTLSPSHRTFGTVDLFLFSAVSWHPHRIHFDQDYTREVEGHEDLLVHGPLQAAHLFDFLQERLPEVELHTVTYRHLNPLHVGVPASMAGEITAMSDDRTSAEIELWMAKENGERTTVGHASVRLPATP